MSEPFTPEQLAQARAAETPEALAAFAAENGVTLTPEEAQAYFNQLHQATGEVSDEELDNVAGGGCMNGGYMVVTALTQCAEPSNWHCKDCCGEGHGNKENTKTYYYCDRLGTGIRVDGPLYCKDCLHCKYERGLWLCKNKNAY